MPLSLFSGFGVELEYMIVDQATLSVRPVADALLGAAAGDLSGEVDRGEIGWSNELVAHVIELKVNRPAERLDRLPEQFQKNICEVNELLAAQGARLMPSGMHPWMNPERETRLWPHEYGEVYQAFDRIFGCRGHGWANLQSLHLNLPFADDDEFARLHAAVRLVLPILPALAASSPIVEGKLTGLLDNRLEAYRTNSSKIARVAGRVIPEAAFSRSEYQAQILEPLYAEIAPHDQAGVLRNEWLNARGAIARFSRNTIEIRVLDVQECPLADLAICAAVVAVLRSLVSERWSKLAKQKSAAVEPLAEILLANIRDAERAEIGDRDYLDLFAYPGDSCTSGELWRHLLDSHPEIAGSASPWREPLRTIIDEGPLARRMVEALAAGAELKSVYEELCKCLEGGTMFHVIAKR
ncbi:MAG TPA: glutamate-cysteine ligase family protein [Planctomycetaceae bacterium]|nr:glutamate-cysteine ligase family protein [Planctomycetaceae bacterium]